MTKQLFQIIYWLSSTENVYLFSLYYLDIQKISFVLNRKKWFLIFSK